MYQQIKDPGSALTHFIGAVMAVAGMPMLLMHASVERRNQVRVLSDPVTVSRERGSNIHCMSSAYEKESQAMICKSGNLLV